MLEVKSRFGRTVYVYAFNTSFIRTVGFELTPKAIMMVYDDKVYVASLTPLNVLYEGEGFGEGDIRLKAEVERRQCFDGAILLDDEVHLRSVLGLTRRGYALLIVKLEKVPDLWRYYKDAVRLGILRAEFIKRMDMSIATCRVGLAILRVKEVGRGKYFWGYANRACVGGCMLARLLKEDLGVSV